MTYIFITKDNDHKYDLIFVPANDIYTALLSAPVYANEINSKVYNLYAVIYEDGKTKVFCPDLTILMNNSNN